MPKAVEEHEIREIVAGYALVAGHCAAGGFDGVELQCSHSSIVRGSCPRPPTGGPTGTAGRWPTGPAAAEIVAAVRAAIGPGLALGVRICGDELIEGGTTIDEAVEVARMAADTGQVDYINTSIGVATATLYMIEASMQVLPGYAMYIPAAIRRAVSLPVVGVGRFKDPKQADRALAVTSATWSAWSAARSPTRISPPRPGWARRPGSAPACPATRNASAGWG